MTKVDNDETKRTAQPFVIIAGRRTGGTYLTHCLSNHPQIYCDRGESIHHDAVWRRHIPPRKIVYVLTHQEGYHASGFRMVYDQAFHKNVWPQILRIKPKVLWLTRENLLRQGTSIAINRLVRMDKIAYFPVHSFEEPQTPRYTIDPAHILKWCHYAAEQDRRAAKRFIDAGLDYLPLTYEQLVGKLGVTQPCLLHGAQERVCGFLGVRSIELCSDLRRVHRHPLAAMFKNWKQIKRAIARSEWAHWLAQEDKWYQNEKGRWAKHD